MIHFFEKEREMEIGMIAMEDILNFFLQNVGGMIYNKDFPTRKRQSITELTS